MSVNHHKQWEFLKSKFEGSQLSHSYLLSGSENIGKNVFAKEFVKFINCPACRQAGQSKTGGHACQECQTCLAIENGNFPDLMFVAPEDGGQIQIARIREVQNFLSLKSYYGAYKSVIVYNAEKMNQEAQSCFLKTLEEPKGQTLIFLISPKPEMLLDTIKSRCQQVKFFGRQIITEEKLSQEEKILRDILKVAGTDVAQKFLYAKSIDFDQTRLSDILVPLEKYTRCLVFQKIVGDKKEYFSNLKSEMENYSVEKLKNIIELIEDINNKMLFTSINSKLALENLLLEI